MRLQLSLALAAVSLVTWPLVADAQDLRTVFKEVSPTVVVIRASGQEITSGGTTRSARDHASGWAPATRRKIQALRGPASRAPR